MATNGTKANLLSKGPVTEAKSNRRSSDRLLLSTRFALGVGFGGLLAIMALAGLDGIRALRQIRRDDDQIRRQFLSRNHALNEIRSSLYLSGTYVRDYLLEPEPDRAEAYRVSLEEVRREMESAIELYGRQLEFEQTKDYSELRTEVSKRTSMDVSVATELGSDELPDEYKTCVYRVVQEALHNCSRHSHATTVRVRVQQEAGRLSLSIQDDGQGFDVKQTKGLGLLGIEERVTTLGGKCEVHSEPGNGTILAVELPLSSDQVGSVRHRDDHDSDFVG